jgi:hypothetical protein
MKATARFFIMISVMVIIIMLFPCISLAEERTVLLGDADGDGMIMIVDCTLIQRDIAGLAEIKAENLSAADVDSNGEICILDATAIQRYLAEMKSNCPIGEYISESSSTTSHLPTVSVSGKTITVDDVAFDTALIPDKTTINDSKTNSKTLILNTKANLAPNDITIQVNNGEYDHKTDYSDERFKESYLMTHNSKIAYGYDCHVRNNKGEAVAWVEAHYFDGWSDPFRVRIYGLKADSYSFPVEFFYKGVSLKKCEVTVALTENHQSIEETINEVRSIEKQCWTSNMTQQEKMKAFAQYVAKNYSYKQVYCNIGADYVAFAARDLGLTSMLLYPGGEPNQTCERHLITYNIYTSIMVPGGHCACLVEYPDGSTLRYDVQGGTYKIKNYL